jgi:TorA maturation chaperone TorD
LRKGRGSTVELRERDSLIASLAEIFTILAEVFLDPEADVKVRLRGLLARCPEDCPGLAGLPGALRGMVDHCEAPQDQAAQYVLLFLHGNGNATVQLYESVHTHGMLMAPEVLDDLNALRDSEDMPPKVRIALPPDHLGYELEILAHLLTEMEREQDPVAQRRKAKAARVLLSRHLIGFARHFMKSLDEARPHPYYRKAGDALVEGLQACTLLLG